MTTTLTPNTLAMTSIDSPCGELRLFASEDGLVAVLWIDEHFNVPMRRPFANVSPNNHPVLSMAVVQLSEYFDGSRTGFELPLIPDGTEFQRDAWRALQAIPYGETRSYGQQAAAIGRPSAVRAVGAANGRNRIPIIIPCHRVIGSNGSLTGFAAGVGTKRWLLDHERRVSGNEAQLFR